jgi:uncharacterized protein (TIGR00661 family)
VIVSSFYDAPPLRDGIRCVGPLLRDEVLRASPVRGSHLLCYFNKGRQLFSAGIERVLRESSYPIVVYGTGREGQEGNLAFRPLHHLRFIEDLATCRSLISTSGNQLIGEAMHLRKPVLVIPEDTHEQRVNAHAIERLGIGIVVQRHAFDGEALRRFLSLDASCAARMRELARDGTSETLAALDEFARALTGRGIELPEVRRAA